MKCFVVYSAFKTHTLFLHYYCYSRCYCIKITPAGTPFSILLLLLLLLLLLNQSTARAAVFPRHHLLLLLISTRFSASPATTTATATATAPSTGGGGGSIKYCLLSSNYLNFFSRFYWSFFFAR